MDDRTRPDTNVVLLRRKGDPSEAERERLASTIFAEPDDIATFSRGNLVPPRPDTREADEKLAPSADPFFDRVEQASKPDGTQPADLAQGGESTDAYFDRLAAQRPAEMSASGAPAPAVTPMPGSALLPAELARPSRHQGRLRGRLVPSAVDMRPWSALRRPRFAWLLSSAVLGVLAAVIAGIAVINASGSPGTEPPQSQREARANSLESLRPGVLSASADPFGATALVYRSVSRVRGPHPANAGRPRSRRAGTQTSARAQTSVNHRVVAATYTPAQRTSSSAGATTETQSSSATGSTTPATPPVTPTHYTSSSNSGSNSGSSSSTPSKAALKSLVTGAGTCSCR